MSNVFDELTWRGLVYDKTEGTAAALANGNVRVYNGFDPTADSLHVGHLVPMMGLARLQRAGHTPIALVGGGTGMIGDPSGRSAERNLLTTEQIEANIAGIRPQLARVLDFDVASNPAQIVNNYDWLSQLSMIDYLRDVGKHFNIGYMMSKESVKNRLGRESGFSYTEFSYMILQSYDFMWLHDNMGVTMQVGGSDQWGNITAGTTLLRKVRQTPVNALVYPLLTRADGSKFGKTADGQSVWLDPERTSPYRFYQYWYNAADADVIKYLQFFTWLDQNEIAALAQLTQDEPHRRAAQTKLAQEITRMLHGETAVARAESAAKVLFGGSLDGLSAADIADIFADVPSSEVAVGDGDGVSVIDLFVQSGLVSSKGDARRSLKDGALNVNNQRVTDAALTLTRTDAVDGRFIVLRKGKKRYHLIKLN